LGQFVAPPLFHKLQSTKELNMALEIIQKESHGIVILACLSHFHPLPV
jgi:hypothetical protein